MLVITRKLNEALMIGEDIEVTVIKLSKDRVRLGITAPKSVQVARKELVETVKLNLQAAESGRNLSQMMQSLQGLL